MHILVMLDRARLFRWHHVLIERLSAAGHQCNVSFNGNPDPLPLAVSLLLDLDRARRQTGPERLSQPLKSVDFDQWSSGPQTSASLCLDLSSGVSSGRDAMRTLTLLFDGSEQRAAFWQAALAQRAPYLSVRDSAGGDWPIGLPAAEHPTWLASLFDQTAARLVQGLTRVVDDIARRHSPPIPETSKAPAPPVGAKTSAGAATYTTAIVASRLKTTYQRLRHDAPKWHVAWRKTDAADPTTLGRLDIANFNVVTDDGQRFYADPVAIEVDGVCHVFIEECPSATGRGVIAHFELGDSGPRLTPVTVLDVPHHLSYPHVFPHDGDIWMLPESGEAGGLDLYRAERFPDRWVCEARLLDEPVHDATLFEHGGRLWIAAASAVQQSSAWDALSLFSADRLTGPWRPHTRNPVVVDARIARPAGAILQIDGRLLRPAQNCSRGYGRSMSLMEITALDSQAFAEHVVADIRFDDFRFAGPHTLSRCGGFELIDVYARPSALRG